MAVSVSAWPTAIGRMPGLSAGSRRNRRSTTIRDTPNRSEPRKKGAPGNVIGVVADVKKLKSPAVKISGENIAVKLVIAVKAP